MLGFPPAPWLDLFRKVGPTTATPAEMRGQDIFFGKGQCRSCHQAPYYTDNLMHYLKIERFFKPELVNGAMEVDDGSI
jgi:cytochrome c peroxidase